MANDGSYGTCNANCSFAPRCGDDMVDAAEETCDDGNTTDDNNGCSDTCQENNSCGNGVPEAGPMASASTFHTANNGTPPAWDDADWADITDLVQVGSGAQVSYREGSLLSTPTLITLPSPVSSRYLRIDASSHGDYVELRSVKAFAN